MTSDIQRCKLDCLDFDAFDFPGAANVTTVNIQHNNSRSRKRCSGT